MGNAGAVQFFGNADLTTLEYIQKRLGKTALEIQRVSNRAEEMVGTRSNSVVLYDLITGEEASRLFARDDALNRQLVIVAGKAPMIIQRVAYYDENDPTQHIKRLVQQDIVEIDGVPTAKNVTMYNVIDNTYTRMKLLEVTYNLPLEDKLFTERELKK